jgi:membrane fusion protein (multidrug efflux system)
VVLEILDIDQVKVAMEVPERDIAALSSVEEMSFTVAALSDRTFTGKVHFVSAKASRSSNSFMVELCLDNPEMTLRPGMIASVSLPRAVMENVVVLPLSAIIAKDGEYVIFVAESDRAARRIVKIASILEREAVIATGLKSGELVVMEGQRSLTDGCLLKIVPADN